MNHKLLLMVFSFLSLFLSLSFNSVNSFAVEPTKNVEGSVLAIQNLKVGLMDDYSKNNNSKVTQQGEQFNYAPNGECLIAQKKQSCMWWGFTFDYKPEITKAVTHELDNTKNTVKTLICKTKKITNTEPNNPRSLFPPSTLHYQSAINLSPNNPHMAINMYATENKGVTTVQTSCSVDSVEYFTVSVKIDFDKSLPMTPPQPSP